MDAKTLIKTVDELHDRRRKIWIMIVNNMIANKSRKSCLTVDAISSAMGYRKPPPSLHVDLRALHAAALVDIDDINAHAYRAPVPILRTIYTLQRRQNAQRASRKGSA